MVTTPLRIALFAYGVALVGTWSLAATSAPHREMKVVLASLGGTPIETLSPFVAYRWVVKNLRD